MQLAFLPPDASPIRRQYLALKRRHPDAILFFQLGDFYETFEEDARIVAEVCDVVLTSREMGRGERFPMAGVPVHAAETYIGRLVERGYHVALCQQVEEPAAAARGGSPVVQREVTRIITPGTLVDPALLPAAKANYLAAVAIESQRTGIAHADISTGDFACAEFQGTEHAEAARAELWRLEPAECLLAEGEASGRFMPPAASPTVDPGLFLDAEETLCSHFQVASIAALGLAERPLAARAAAAILRYAARSHPPALPLLTNLRIYDPLGCMILDPTTRAHLEILRTVRGRKEGALLHTLDRTRTPMGGRLLALWLGRPLLDRAAIEQRLDAVAALLEQDRLRGLLRDQLGGLPDLQRLAGRAGQRLVSPREALALARGVELAEEIRQTVGEAGLAALAPQRARMDLPLDLGRDIRENLAEEPSAAFGEGVIRPGRVPELDELRGSASDGRQWLLDLERRERERTGVKNLKVGYNRVFGYYLEVTSAALSQPLDYYRRQETGAATVGQLLEHLSYQRRQTLATVERFLVPELRDYEMRQARSAARMAELEREAYERLLSRMAAEAPPVLAAAEAIAELDCLACLAEVAREYRYVRPEVVDEAVTEIVGGRHPVVERALGWGAYIPNGASLARKQRTRNSPERPSLIILTGPNMAGKTTYGRAVLLISLLAQAGSFVPAERARLGLVDRLLLRSGASDDISAGQSTFMVEMTETAAILRSASARSLAFFDEVGRGTSTYDGMAIARAIAEYLATSPEHGCRAIFSTHYHELAAIEDELPAVKNYRMEVHEAADRVSFTYRVVPGSTDRSYGVHVARLAGLPPSVVGRAEEVLVELEAESRDQRGQGPDSSGQAGPQAAASVPGFLQDLAEVDVDRMTPVEALNTLARLRAAARTQIGREAGPTDKEASP